ncbi:hypothetical protein VKT23_000365 [Stygiomarasmius scandens]|uniref:CBM1 domain-containing protein n=1 Tax=Marasmiellus scandens TaxID=2682957 RepID=A0ABR1K494_9AGAR
MWFKSSNIIPIGNGRLGAQILGQFPNEVVVLNEDHIWSGSMNDPNNRNCAGALPRIRQYIWSDDLSDAQSLVGSSCMANPISQQEFQTAGNLTLSFPNAGMTNYNHSLDLTTALATTTYQANGVTFTRQALASNPDNIIAMRFSASQSGQVQFTAGFTTPMGSPSISSSGKILTLTAKGLSRSGLPASINFVVQAEVTVTGSGATVSASNGHLQVSGADEALLVIAIDTNYVRYDDLSGNPQSKVTQTLTAVRGKTWNQLLITHLSDYQALFNRFQISLGTPTSNSWLPTDQRKSLPGGADADQDLFSLYTQYGRYLAISSSRKTEPSNLQGIWNAATDPVWGSKYTLNINQQMNSWLSEPLNIAETLDPLWNMLTEVAERGKTTAAEEYNIQRGWVAHHNTGLWRDSAPIDGAQYGMWPLAPAWLMQNVWEHWAFNPSLTDWVRNVAYPMMKNLCEFYLDFLVVAPSNVEPNQYLVTNPSMSPEHTISGSLALTYGSTIDTALLKDLFNHTAGFAHLLNTDSDFANNLTSTMSRLMPIRIGSLGQIQEYARDYNANGPFNHISQLYPLFPGAQIDPRFNTSLSNAAQVTLQERGDSDNGWPTAWRACFFARLLDGEKAYYYMKRLLQLYSYGNLWSINLIFQIDANFGGANAVAEMILQSHNGEIHLLPAIPSSWSKGSVSGMRARGGFTVDIAWNSGKLTSATIKSTSGAAARVRYGSSAINLSLQGGGSQVLTPSNFGGSGGTTGGSTGGGSTGGGSTGGGTSGSSGSVPKWGQCGGIGYSGSTQCESGSTCTYSNPYYSQCV